MLEATASSSFWPSELDWSFRGSTRSLLFRFREGEPDEVLAGAIATWSSPMEIRPGVDVHEASLEFWADPEMQPYLREGEPFWIWHGYDLGKGIIHRRFDRA